MTDPFRRNGQELVDRVAASVDIDRRLGLVVRAHRRRQQTRWTAVAAALFAFVGGLVWLARLEPDVPEPAVPGGPVEVYLVLTSGYETVGNECSGTGSFAGVTAGGVVEMVDLDGSGSNTVKPLTLPPGALVRPGHPEDFVLSGESEVCLFRLGDLGVPVERIYRVTFYPLIPDEVLVFSTQGTNRAVFRTTHVSELDRGSETSPQMLLDRSVMGVETVVDLLDQGGTLLVFGDGCDYDEVHVYFGQGELADLWSSDVGGPIAEVVVDIRRFRDCEPYETLIGYIETETVGSRLDTRRVGPYSILMFDPDDLSGIIREVVVDLTWTRIGEVVPYQFAESNHSWGWSAPARVVGSVYLDGEDMGVPTRVEHADITFKMGFTYGVNLYNAIGEPVPSPGCQALNDPAFTGSGLSSGGSVRVVLGSGETITATGTLPGGGTTRLQIPGYGAREEAAGSPLILPAPHGGAFDIVWNAVDLSGSPLEVVWTFGCTQR